MGKCWDESPDLMDFLSTDRWTLDHLSDLISFGVREGIHIDYKAGSLIGRRVSKEQRRDIRRFVVGFANADGGVIVLGMDENGGIPTALAPIPDVPPNGLTEWFTRLMNEAVSPKLHPPPEIHEIKDGEATRYAVLVVRPHDAGLARVRMGDRFVFPCRMGDSVIDLDDWFVQAVLFGTKRRPALAVRRRSDSTFNVIPTLHTDKPRNPELQRCRFSGGLGVSNESFVWAESLVWGWIAPTEAWQSITPTSRPEPLPQTLRAQLRGDIQKFTHVRVIRQAEKPDIAPFQEFPLRMAMDLNLPPSETWCRFTMAMYLVGKNFGPDWFLLDFEVREHVVEDFQIRQVEPPVEPRLVLHPEWRGERESEAHPSEEQT